MTTTDEQPYDYKAFAIYLGQLLETCNESMREASLASGLDHSALHRFTRNHQRPTRDSCIAIADHFDLNPNEVLARAGYPPLHFFDRSLVDPQSQPPYVADLASYLSRISPPSRRRQICQSLLRMLELTMETSGSV